MTGIKPATDEDIRSWQIHNDPAFDGTMVVGIPAMHTDKRGMLSLIARIEADRKEIAGLKARIAEFEAVPTYRIVPVDINQLMEGTDVNDY